MYEWERSEEECGVIKQPTNRAPEPVIIILRQIAELKSLLATNPTSAYRIKGSNSEVLTSFLLSLSISYQSSLVLCSVVYFLFNRSYYSIELIDVSTVNFKAPSKNYDCGLFYVIRV